MFVCEGGVGFGAKVLVFWVLVLTVGWVCIDGSECRSASGGEDGCGPLIEFHRTDEIIGYVFRRIEGSFPSQLYQFCPSVVYFVAGIPPELLRGLKKPPS